IVLLDLLHELQSTGDLAEHRVHAVQMTRVGLGEHHEKLAATGILAGMRHGERTDLVLARVARRLALDLPAGTAGADARITFGQIARERIAALNDEVGNDAVELHAVVETAVSELLEVLNRLRCVGVVKLRGDSPAIGLESCSLQRRLRTGLISER